MKRRVIILVEGQRLELFDDEQITINSSIQNISDISKIFTDFSQSFTVPASPTNNEIFQHFYNSEVLESNGNITNPQLRRKAIIEIDGIEFRRGKIQLEKSDIKNGKPYSYTCTFYGELVSLKDSFGDKTLQDMDWSNLSHTYTYAEVKDRIENDAVDYDVRYPLISAKRYWQYDNSSTPLDNIDTTTGAIKYNELFPAVKISAIFQEIESQFNINFSGGFLGDPKFTNAFFYFKNKSEYSYVTPPQILQLTEVFDGQGNSEAVAPFDYSWDVALGDQVNANSTTNAITLAYQQWEPFAGQYTDSGFHRIEAIVTNTTSNVTYFFDVYRQGQLIDTVEITGGGDATTLIYEENNYNNPSLNSEVYFRFRSELPLGCTIELTYAFVVELLIVGEIPFGYRRFTTSAINTTTSLDLATSAPNIKVADWFSDILKLFNLTCFGTSENNYTIETLEEFYNTGDIFDITEYVNEDTIDVSRIKLFKNIKYEYAQSKSITNREFASLFMREYGNLKEQFNYDGGDYTIGVKFENLLFSKFEDTELQVGYCIDENLNSYVPTGIVLYKRTDALPCSFYLTDELTNTDEITEYVCFGQDLNSLNQEYSLNWGTEISSLLLENNFGGLYNTYYKSYIENLYNVRNREIKVKSRLPISILTDLDLKDRVIIRDKRYIINNLKINLTSAEVDLVLTNDFRKMIADEQPPLIPPIRPEPTPGCIRVYIPFIKNAVQATLSQCVTSVSGVTISPSTITQAQFVEICLPDNTDSTNYLITEEPSARIATEVDSEQFILDESGGLIVVYICVTYTLSNGNTVANQIQISY